MDIKKNTLREMTADTYTGKAVEIVTKALSDAGINNEIYRSCTINQETENTWSIDFTVKVLLGELFINSESAG
jgi:hypothetical protein